MSEPLDDDLVDRGEPGGRVVAAIAAVERVVGGALVLLIFALILTQALQRYLPVDGWVWTGELARFSLVWLTFAMAGYVMGRDDHIALEVADYVTTGPARRAVHTFAHVVTAVVCLAFCYEAWSLITLPGVQTSPALGIPMKWVFVVPLVGLALTALRAVVAIVTGAPGHEPGHLAAEGPRT